MVCPKCQQDVTPQPVGFTWWGGFVGAKVINHVECPSCHGRFNGKTGKPNDKGIAIYIGTVSVMFAVVIYFMFRSMN